MRKAQRILVVTKNSALSDSLCDVINHSDRRLAGVTTRIDLDAARHWRRQADVVLIGIADLLAFSRYKRRALMLLTQVAPPLLIVLHSDQLLDLVGYLDRRHALIFLDDGLGTLLEACDLALDGMMAMPARVWRRIRDRDLWYSRLRLLTDREQHILKLLAQALPNRQIAAVTGLAPGSVNTIVRTIIRKLGLTNRTAAAMLFRRLGDRPTGLRQ
ncbi:MAG TPA: LuxR C-terminal-related transcriptional regulator [Ferrovibrio sp.]|uniref:helix-turn-helix transcriptional regulator n=1 Tax=Ferrovibrio sp. TaxID=1917215 RepID=UPI002ED61BC6